MEFWNMFSFLNSYFEFWLSLSSEFFNVDPNLTYLYGLGLVLFIYYLVWTPSVFHFWKTRKKCRVTAKRRRKGGTQKGWSSLKREIEKRKLVSILKRTPDHKPDTIRFRRLLCPDPSCEVCNSVTSEVSQLLFPDILEDSPPLQSTLTSSTAEPSTSSSPASSREPAGDPTFCSLRLITPPPPSNSSPNSLMSPEGLYTAPSWARSLQPEPPPLPHYPLPLTHSPSQPCTMPSLLTHGVQSRDSVLQPGFPVSCKPMYRADPIVCLDLDPIPDLTLSEKATGYARQPVPATPSIIPPAACTVTITKVQKSTIILTPVQKNTATDSPAELSACVSAVTTTDRTSISLSQVSLWQDSAKEFLVTNTPPADINLPSLAIQTSQTSFGEDPVANLIQMGDSSMLSPEVLATLERHIEKRVTFPRKGHKENQGGPLRKQLHSKARVNLSEKETEAVVSQADSEISLCLEGSAQELQVPEEPHHHKALHFHSQQQHCQFFWGLPSLHSESLAKDGHDLGDLSSVCFFNGIPTSASQPLLPACVPTVPLSLSEGQPPASPPILQQGQETPQPVNEPQVTYLGSHLREKYQQISECQFPDSVESSWQATQQTLLEPNQYDLKILQRRVDCSLSNTKEPSLIHCTAQEMLNSQRQRSDESLSSGLIPKIPEYINLTKCPTSSASLTTISDMTPEGNFQSGALGGLPWSCQEDKDGMANGGPAFVHHAPVPTTVGKEGQGVPGHSPVNTHQEIAEAIRKTKGECLIGPSKLGLRDSQRECSLFSVSPPKLSSKSAVDKQDLKPKDSLAEKLDRPQKKDFEKEELFVNVAISREIFRSKELAVLQSKNRLPLARCKSVSCQTSSADDGKEESTKHLQTTPPVISDKNSPALKVKLLAELKLELGLREQRQAQGKAALEHSAQTPLSPAEGRLPVKEEKPVVRCPQKSFASTANTTSSSGPKRSELGGRDAGLGSVQPTRRSLPSKHLPAEEDESKPSQLSSQKGQPPAQNLFKQKIKDFWQGIFPAARCTKVENAQGKGSPACSAQSRGASQARAAPSGKTYTQKGTDGTDKPLSMQVGHKQGSYATSPPKPSPAPRKSGAPLWTDGKTMKESTQGKSSSLRAAPSKVIAPTSHRHAPVLGGQARPASPELTVAFRQPQRPLKSTIICPRHGPQIYQGGSVPPSTPLCRWHGGQWAQAVTAECSAFSDRPLERDQFLEQRCVLHGYHMGNVYI